MATDEMLIILRQRLKSVQAQADIMRAEQDIAGSMRHVFNDGWMGASLVEAYFLADLIAKIEREGVTT